MKILNLKIISPKNEIIRDIYFSENGLSIILGDILYQKDYKKTSNSLGKTLLLKFLDYIYGANNDKNIVPESLNDYTLEAKLKYNNEIYNVKRKLESSSKISINNKIYSLEEYKTFFEIDRSIFHKQILLENRQGLISRTFNPTKIDFLSFIKLLNLEDLLETTENIYSIQDNIKDLKKAKNQMSVYLNETSELDEKIFILNKEIQKLESELSIISEKIKKMETTDIKENIIEKYQLKNIEFKEKTTENFINEVEIKRMKKFLKEYENIDVSSKTLFSLYKKTKIEIPELVKRKIEDVEKFHQNVYSDRKNILTKKIETLTNLHEEKEKELKILSTELNYLGKIIAENKVYQENLELYEKYSFDLKEKKYQQGQFSQVENIITQISQEDDKLNDYFAALKKAISKDSNEIKLNKFKDFIYDFVKNVYSYENEETISYFKFEVRNKHQVTRPFKLEITIDYDRGEGVGQVKKVMIDILIFKFNKLLDFFIQDSSSYVGIDSRQIFTILTSIDEIAKTINKQAIISINKYQVISDDKILDFVNNKSVIKLSENDKLLKFNFK